MLAGGRPEADGRPLERDAPRLDCLRQLAAEGKTEVYIASSVENRSVDQVKRVLVGKTYKRIA